MQAFASLNRGELPGKRALLRVALGFQSRGALTQRVEIGTGSAQTATGQDADLDLSHVEPTAVFGRRMEREPLAPPVRLLRREGRVEGGGTMGVEVVLHHPDDPRRMTRAE